MRRPRSPLLCAALALVLAACSGDATAPTPAPPPPPPVPTTGPASLSFTDQPSEVAIGERFEVMVAVTDSFGNAVASAPQPLRLTVLDQQLIEKLTVEAQINGGSARFTDLRINEIGEAFTLRVDYAALSATVGPMETFLPFLQIDAGKDHTCGVADAHVRPGGTEIPAGVVYCWGSNEDGKVQPLTRTFRLTSTRPIPASGDNRFGAPALEVVAGGEHTCSRLETREARCWGSDTFGQMGRGSSGPASLGTPITGFSFFSIIAGDVHTCATILPTASGSIVCWGDNRAGQVDASVPLNPTAPAVIDVIGARRIAPGEFHSCAAFATETRCWGWDDRDLLGHGGAQSGNDGVTSVVAGGSVFQELAAGSQHTCGLDEQGQAWCWGENEDGQLGDGTEDDSGRPVLAAAPAGVQFRSIDVGLEHTCAIDTNDVAYCWGEDGAGRDVLVPVPVPGGLRLLDLATGYGHTCGLTAARRAYCWGKGSRGRLGNGDENDSTVPVAVR